MEPETISQIAVIFLARGAESHWRASCESFLTSYQQIDSGLAHSLFVILKGFSRPREIEEAKQIFVGTEHSLVMMDDDSFDIGAYVQIANQLNHKTICFLNTKSIILADKWLYKLVSNLALPGIGLVGATGSFESMRHVDGRFPSFPNPHIRTNAFMMNRARFCEITNDLKITDKLSTHNFESGPDGLTKRIVRSGLQPLVVGRNGRGYSVENWVTSGTFRQTKQENLLITDNQTQFYQQLSFAEKSHFATMAWGRYLRKPPLIADRTSLLRSK